MIRAPLTGARAGVVRCGGCGLHSRPTGPSVPGNCRRCGEALAFRRRDPIQRTWALIIAAAICYLPANLLPVMTTTTLKSVRPDTIIGGVVHLYATGSWVLALIVLVLTAHWLLSFFGQSIFPGIPHTSGFTDMLSVVIVVLITIRFLS